MAAQSTMKMFGADYTVYIRFSKFKCQELVIHRQAIASPTPGQISTHSLHVHIISRLSVLSQENPPEINLKVWVPERVAVIHVQEQQGTSTERSLNLESLLKIDH